MKKIIISVIFIIITVFIFINIDTIINREAADFRQIYYEKLPIDVLFVGTSRVSRAFSPMYIWNKYGILSYNRALDAQYYKTTYYFTEEAFKLKKPKFVIVDVYFLATLLRVEWAVSHTKGMNLSYIKYKAIKDIYSEDENIINNLFGMYQFHTRWKELRKYDFESKSYYKGWLNESLLYTTQPQKKVNYNFDNITADMVQADTIKYAEKIIDISKKYGAEVIFVDLPNCMNNNTLNYIKAFELFCKKHNWNYINFNDLSSELNIDYSKDFYNYSHLNKNGAKKVTDYMIKYLLDKYGDITYHNKKLSKIWDNDYLKYERAVNTAEIKKLKIFNDWYDLSNYDNYTILISSNGDNVLNRLPQDMKDKFTTLGLNKFETDKKNQKYAAIIDDGKVFFEEISDKKVEYKGRMKNKVNLLVSSVYNNATINVSGKQRSQNKYGINFVIYDKINREIVDSIWLDPSNFNQIRR